MDESRIGHGVQSKPKAAVSPPTHLLKAILKLHESGTACHFPCLLGGGGCGGLHNWVKATYSLLVSVKYVFVVLKHRMNRWRKRQKFYVSIVRICLCISNLVSIFSVSECLLPPCKVLWVAENTEFRSFVWKYVIVILSPVYTVEATGIAVICFCLWSLFCTSPCALCGFMTLFLRGIDLYLRLHLMIVHNFWNCSHKNKITQIFLCLQRGLSIVLFSVSC